MVDMKGKVEICGEVFTEEKVWDAVLKASEQTAGFFWPYSDISDFIDGKTTEEENLVYEILKK